MSSYSESFRLDYFRGVRLVKTQFNRLIRAEILHVDETTREDSVKGFYRYATHPSWQIDLEMLYNNKPCYAINVWDFFYTAPCAALTFIAEEGTSNASSRPELITAFILKEFRK